MGTYSMLAAFAGIILLTVILVVVNVRSSIRDYKLHRYMPRLVAQMMGLLLVGAMLITLSYFVLDRTMDAALFIQEEALQRQVPVLLKKV